MRGSFAKNPVFNNQIKKIWNLKCQHHIFYLVKEENYETHGNVNIWNCRKVITISVDFSAYMAHIMECEEAQHTQMRNQYMYLYNKNLYIFANKMECGHTYFKHVNRKCVVCNTIEKWTLNWSIDNSCKHFIKHCLKLVESHRRYCFPIWTNKLNKILQHPYKSLNLSQNVGKRLSQKKICIKLNRQINN